jgi:hypothetical protein
MTTTQLAKAFTRDTASAVKNLSILVAQAQKLQHRLESNPPKPDTKESGLLALENSADKLVAISRDIYATVGILSFTRIIDAQPIRKAQKVSARVSARALLRHIPTRTRIKL